MVQKYFVIAISCITLIFLSSCARKYTVRFTFQPGQELRYSYSILGDGQVNVIQRGQSGYGGNLDTKISADFVIVLRIDHVGPDTMAVTRWYESLKIVNRLGGLLEKLEMSKGELTYYNNKIKDQSELTATQRDLLDKAGEFLMKKRLILPRRGFRYLMVPEFVKISDWLHKLNIQEVVSAATPAIPNVPITRKNVWHYSRPLNIRKDTEVLRIKTKYWFMDKKGKLIAIDYMGTIDVGDIFEKEMFGSGIDVRINNIREENNGRVWLNYKTGIIEKITGDLMIFSDITAIQRDLNIQTDEKTKFVVKFRLRRL